jgi:hypothetical protein
MKKIRQRHDAGERSAHVVGETGERNLDRGTRRGAPSPVPQPCVWPSA